MRRHHPREFNLPEGGHRRDDEFCAGKCRRERWSGELQADLATAAMIPEPQRLSLENRGKRDGVASPQPDLMSLLAQIGSRRIAAIPPSQNGDAHGLSQSLARIRQQYGGRARDLQNRMTIALPLPRFS